MHVIRTASILAAITLSCMAPGPARADGAPIVAVGTSSKWSTTNFTTYSVGWRFPLPSVDTLDRLGKKAGGEITLLVEPLLGIITGDTDSVEFAVAPMVRYERGIGTNWAAFLEAGLGLAYSDLRGIKLGSRIHFASQGGAGLARTSASGTRVSVGLRLRHISHAGLWAEANSGLNTSYLTVSFD